MRRKLVLGLTACLGLVCGAAVAAQAVPFAEQSSATQVVAEKYFAAYIARDWDKLERLLAEEGSFTDPTAEPVFGAVQSLGKPAVMKNFREGYAQLKYMRFNRMRTVFSGKHALFEGTLDWALTLEGDRVAVTNAMPFLTILRVEGGLVVEHTDFADYQPFIDAYKKAKAGG